jgi:hypothetical protein
MDNKMKKARERFLHRAPLLDFALLQSHTIGFHFFMGHHSIYRTTKEM